MNTSISSVASSPPSGIFQMWQSGEVIVEIPRQPQLALWIRRTDPKKMALEVYLDEVQAKVGELPSDGLLSLDLTAVRPENSRPCDLENFLTPLAKRFGHARFVHATATKQVDGSPRIRFSYAQPLDTPKLDQWRSFSCNAGRGPQSKGWKERLREGLIASKPEQLKPGPVEVHLAWRSSSRRDWVDLWKPTGDTMGPVLGEPLKKAKNRPYDPLDDRITRLHLHLTRVEALAKDIDVAMWWKAIA